MFNWYAKGRCYVYLADVEHDGRGFRDSRWFTRAWTLQELIAPPTVQFFSKEWTSLGMRDQLCDAISNATRIEPRYLQGSQGKGWWTASISNRMSWAARRQATRGEDIAYSLLGLFDVNLPPLYGEGPVKAFRRLQQAIMEQSEDQTLLTWHQPFLLEDQVLDGRAEWSEGLLASGPLAFLNANKFVPAIFHDIAAPYRMTNHGLEMTVPITHIPVAQLRDLHGLPLSVSVDDGNYKQCAVLQCSHVDLAYCAVVVPVKRLAAQSYQRVANSPPSLVPAELVTPILPTTIFLKSLVSLASFDLAAERYFRHYPVVFRALPKELMIRDCHVSTRNSVEESIFWGKSYHLSTFELDGSRHPNWNIFIGVGRSSDGQGRVRPWWHVETRSGPSEMFNAKAFYDMFRLCPPGTVRHRWYLDHQNELHVEVIEEDKTLVVELVMQRSIQGG